MRIIARPAHANIKTDPGNSALYKEIESLPDVHVLEGSSRNLLFGKGDVLHVHWPDNVLRDRRWVFSAVRMFALMGMLSLQRVRGARVVWTAHNAHTHEQHHPKLERLFWRMLFRRLDGIISHSQTVKRDLENRTGGRIPITVIPLSHFKGMYPDAPLVKKPDGVCIGFVGRIRLYKGVPDLVRAFADYRESTVRMIVRGKPEDAETARVVSDLCAKDARIDLKLGFLSSADLVAKLARMDVVVLPFKWVTNSGSALLALSQGVRVVVPETEYFAELREEFGSEWVYCYQGDLTGAVIAELVAWAKQPKPRPVPVFPEQRSIPWAARATVDFLQKTLSSS